MIPVPADWLTIADRTHAPEWSVELLPAGGGAPVLAAATGGRLNRSGDTYPRARLTVQVPAGVVPGIAPAHLLPYGAQVRVLYRPDRREPWHVVAHLHTVRSWLGRPEGMWELEAVDASGLIAEDAIHAHRPAAFTGTVGDVVTGLIRRTLPAATVTVAGDAATTAVPADWEPDNDPWRCVEQLTDLAGATVSIDPQAPWTFHVHPYPEIGEPADRVRVKVNMTGYGVGHERTYNSCAVIYRDKGTGAVTRTGWWVDDRPASLVAPAKVGQHITLVIDDAHGTPTQVQADAAARARGLRQTGRARIVAADCVPRPWLMPGDTLRMDFLGGPYGELHLLTSVGINLDGSPTELGTRNSLYTREGV